MTPPTIDPNAPVRVWLAGLEQFALVDQDDWEIVQLLRWRVHRPATDAMQKYGRGAAGDKVYARASLRDDRGRKRDIYLHRFLLAVNDGHVVNHIDGDGLNCTRRNLEEVTLSENGVGSRPWKERR